MLFNNSATQLKIITTFILVLLSPFIVFSQLSQGGTPSSFDKKESLKPISEISIIEMPFVDVEMLLEEDKINDLQKGTAPWRFGKNINVNISNKTHGIWEKLPNNNKIWRLVIHSPGALSINLTYNNFRLPKNSKLFIYNYDKTQIIGAFTELNNRDDRLFATDLVFGDKIVLEYEEPYDADFSGDIEINIVTHAYRGVKEFEKNFGSSGSCNVNVACPQALPMSNQINSVVMLVSGSNGFCTGALINNQNNDGTPYVLSANHCYQNPSTVIFRFNWQSSTCNNPPSSPSHQSLTGAIQRARNTTSDFWLMQISNAIPASFNPYFAGWNRISTLPSNEKVWGIHHPSGDIKKISWSSSGLSTTSYLQNDIPGSGSHWRVTKWDDGTTTEGGSSGSPLFDSNGNIIGQLHGGYASCTSNTSDWYGKLSVSWNGGGSSSSRLRDWLAPLDSAVTSINGFNPNALQLDAQLVTVNGIATSYCGVSMVTPSIVIKNSGITSIVSATVGYSLNGASNVTQNWTGNLATGQSTTVNFPQITLNTGLNQTFNAFVSNPNSGTDLNLNNNNLNLNINVAAEITLPHLEGFEGSFIPPCWTQQQITGSVSWTRATGGQSSNPPSAYNGSFNALFYNPSSTAVKTMLISPVLNLQSALWPSVSFWHVQRPWSSDQDELRVYYRTSPTSQWVLLAQYTSAVTNWTNRVIQLPNYNATYQIAFEGTAKYGYGVGLDHIEIINSPTILADKNQNNNIIIYPNPTKDEINIHKEDNSFMKVQVLDIKGKIIYQTSFNDIKLNINLNSLGLSKGIYFIHLISDKDKIVRKLVFD